MQIGVSEFTAVNRGDAVVAAFAHLIRAERRLCTATGHHRILSCYRCNAPLCFGSHILSTVSNRNGNPHPLESLFHTQTLGNVQLVDENGSVHTALLVDGRAIVAKPIICGQCEQRIGFKVIAVENDNGFDDIVVAGQYIVQGRIFEQIP